ncbi:hypothetical protein ANO11243_009170 [Dothideomycetidae sp. 11243]|nr:hypothetical protein ANO11243_009170 [fungal sp. No.11243]
MVMRCETRRHHHFSCHSSCRLTRQSHLFRHDTVTCPSAHMSNVPSHHNGSSRTPSTTHAHAHDTRPPTRNEAGGDPTAQTPPDSGTNADSSAADTNTHSDADTTLHDTNSRPGSHSAARTLAIPSTPLPSLSLSGKLCRNAKKSPPQLRRSVSAPGVTIDAPLTTTSGHAASLPSAASPAAVAHLPLRRKEKKTLSSTVSSLGCGGHQCMQPFTPSLVDPRPWTPISVQSTPGLRIRSPATNGCRGHLASFLRLISALTQAC